MNRIARISFINTLSPHVKNFLAKLHSTLETDDFRVLREGGNDYGRAVVRMDRVRCQLLEQVTREPDYNQSEFINSLLEAVTEFSCLNLDAKVEDYVLAIAILKSLYSINTTESLNRLYLYLKDPDIDAGVRVSTINYLVSTKDNAVLPKLREIKTYFESNPGSEFDHGSFINFLDRAIEIMERENS